MITDGSDNDAAGSAVGRMGVCVVIRFGWPLPPLEMHTR